MYIPSTFQQQDLAQLHQLVRDYPLATLIATASNQVEACHVPLVWHDDGSEWGCLYGHVAKVNPIYQLADPITDDTRWLAIFQDSGHYISPNWYPSKALTHKEVPTWNYRSVHLTTRVQLIHEPERLKQMLAELTQQSEQNQPTPWQLSDAPEDYLNAMCRAIVGFKLPITAVQGQFKLSQNKSAQNKASVVKNLQQLGTDKAAQMANLVNNAH